MIQTKRAFEMLGLRHGLTSNEAELIQREEFFEGGEIHSQATNWGQLQELDQTDDLDSNCLLVNKPESPPSVEILENELTIRGDLGAIEKNARDRRWAILGNQGIWFRFLLGVQERHGIFSLHAASAYHPERERLLILLGKAGAGKSVLLLSVLELGYRIFSTEMTFFQIMDGEIRFLRGSLIDNLRIGTLLVDFPSMLESLEIVLPASNKPWREKISVDLHRVGSDMKEIANPTISILLPRIEAGIEKNSLHALSDKPTLQRILFDFASEKIAGSVLIDEKIPAVGFDSPELALARLEAIGQLMSLPVHSAAELMANAQNCLEGIDL
jgi:hypothetical protein